MPRQLRLEYPGAIYHVMSRANGKENIFETDIDRQDFIKTLAEAGAKTGFQVHAYCLMRHHFHLVVETPQGNLVAGRRWLLRAYTLRFRSKRGQPITRLIYPESTYFSGPVLAVFSPHAVGRCHAGMSREVTARQWT